MFNIHRPCSPANRFREILVAAGLAEPVTHKCTGKRRDAARESAGLSFHSLRHSAVTFLKTMGVSGFKRRVHS